MIIVSQDKERIVNFNNLTQIYVTQDEEETAYYIRFETVDSLYEDLGNYKTEERAKEVLQEIIKRINGKGEIIKNINEIKIETEASSLYEMPEV